MSVYTPTDYFLEPEASLRFVQVPGSSQTKASRFVAITLSPCLQFVVSSKFLFANCSSRWNCYQNVDLILGLFIRLRRDKDAC